MHPRQISILIALGLAISLVPVGTPAARQDPPAGSPEPADKIAVLDGHVYHDRAEVWNHVTNFGLIGSMPTAGLPYSDAPSARWPGETGVDYLWAAGLWVGAVILGEPCVTTGAYAFELRPTEAPGDTIYATAMGAVGGARYPDPLPDDDADGREDEDPLNGIDDDADGRIDEDFAAIGDQHFRCVYSDTAAAIGQAYPDHRPLGIAVTQQSFQWDEAEAAGFLGYDFTVTNVGDVVLDQVYLGLFADFDITTWAGGADDDLAGSWSGQVPVADGSVVPVSLAYMYDGGDYGSGTGYVGFVLCGTTTQEACPLDVVPVVESCQIFMANVSFSNGGDPTNDAEQYLALSAGTWDADVDPGQAADYRVLIASGPFPLLAPGGSLIYRVALVAGADLPELLAAAGEAVRTCQGYCYDRNGDPLDGREFHVPWLREEDTPVAAAAGSLLLAAADGGIVLQVATNQPEDADLSLVRRAQAYLPGRTWTREQWELAGMAGGQKIYRVTDTDSDPRPRTYDLVMEAAGGGALELATATWDGVSAAPPRLLAAPNPFNPKLEILYTLQEQGRAALEVFDMRGRLVRILFDDSRPAGSGREVWSGEDADGRPVPSGMYLVRLRTTKMTASSAVTLVR